jgi:hypothetical protein
VEKLIGEPFTFDVTIHNDERFYYPDTVGNLDRKNKELLQSEILKESEKAVEMCKKLYRTNHLED